MSRAGNWIAKKSIAHFIVVMLCVSIVFASGLPVLKSEPARPADINSIKGVYISRSHPNYSINDVLRFVAFQDPSHLPLYHVVLSLWIRYTGRDLFTIRLLSLFTGLLAIAITYRLARETTGKEAALDTVLIASFLAFFIFYAHQARMYALLTLASSWTMLSYWRVLKSGETSSRRWWLSLLASSTVLVYTHYFSFFLLAAIGAYHLFFAPKNRRWLQICLAFVGVGLLYSPWLPYTLSILRIRDVPATDALALGDALLALLSIYSNGLPLVFAVAAAWLVLRFRQLSSSQIYVTIVCVFVFALLLFANEITALIIARRIRYTIAAGIILSCNLATALNLLPRWNLLRLPFTALWVALFVTYWHSSEFYLYTNQLDQKHNTVPHFQDLLYEPSIQPRRSDFVLSFHRDTPLNEKKILEYYGNKVGNWRGLIHISTDVDGNPTVQSTDTRYREAPSMTAWNFPIWLVHNPQETDLRSMDVYANEFLRQFHACGRFLETDDSIVDLFVKRVIPCSLITAPAPLAIDYEAGAELANVMLEPGNGRLNVYFWWTNTIANRFAFSLQLFDEDGGRAAQLDDVIGGDALYHRSLEIADLPAGDYRAMLVVYDFESLESQSGTVVADKMQFDRELEIGRISIGD